MEWGDASRETGFVSTEGDRGFQALVQSQVWPVLGLLVAQQGPFCTLVITEDETPRARVVPSYVGNALAGVWAGVCGPGESSSLLSAWAGGSCAHCPQPHRPFTP